MTSTWKFANNDVTDVASGLSDHYVWDASNVLVDSKTKRRANIQAAYNDTAKHYHHMIEFELSTLQFLSSKWPGIPFLFPKMTVSQVHGGSGNFVYIFSILYGHKQNEIRIYGWKVGLPRLNFYITVGYVKRFSR